MVRVIVGWGMRFRLGFGFRVGVGVGFLLLGGVVVPSVLITTSGGQTRKHPCRTDIYFRKKLALDVTFRNPVPNLDSDK